MAVHGPSESQAKYTVPCHEQRKRWAAEPLHFQTMVPIFELPNAQKHLRLHGMHRHTSRGRKVAGLDLLQSKLAEGYG